MDMPGEITIARKPLALPTLEDTYNRYRYNGVKRIAVHRHLLDCAEEHIPSNSKVLDLGAGLGLLAERIAPRCKEYLGVD